MGMIDFEDELKKLSAAGLLRRLRSISSGSGPKIVIDGKTLLMLASNDYLGLCADTRVKQATARAVQKWGGGTGAARLISGNLDLFAELEKRLADFKQTEDALVFSTGYMANAGLLSALAGKGDIIFSDALNHASIIDGCRLSRAETGIYPHKDLNRLETLLTQSRACTNRYIVTDGVFSMDGDIAPLPALLSLAEKYDAVIILDDAHGTGAIGKTGKGTLEHFGMKSSPRIIIMGTLGKALGSFGAFAAGTASLKPFLVNRARSFIFTTALPPAVPAAALAALDRIEQDPGLVRKLKENAALMREGLCRLGFDIMETETQIIPVMIGRPEHALHMAKELFARGLFIQAIRPPTVPENASRLRITVMAAHEKKDLAEALDILGSVGKKLGII